MLWLLLMSTATMVVTACALGFSSSLGGAETTWSCWRVLLDPRFVSDGWRRLSTDWRADLRTSDPWSSLGGSIMLGTIGISSLLSPKVLARSRRW